MAPGTTPSDSLNQLYERSPVCPSNITSPKCFVFFKPAHIFAISQQSAPLFSDTYSLHFPQPLLQHTLIKTPGYTPSPKEKTNVLESSAVATPETHSQLTVRPARDADALTLREIFNEAVEDGLVTFESTPRSLEEQQRLIAEAERDSRHPILVADVRNWTCGVATLEPFDARRGLHDLAEVEIFVRRSFRSYGVGRQLMRAVQTEAARLGYRKLIGRVLGDSQDTLRLCQATGWREVGRHEQHARHGDRLRDVVVVEFHVPPVPAAE
jgi:L-amino acid N-acyltransferase